MNQSLGMKESVNFRVVNRCNSETVNLMMWNTGKLNLKNRWFVILLLFAALLTGDRIMAEQKVNNTKDTTIKLTFLGEQDKPIATMLISSTQVEEPMNLFSKLGLMHSNDKFGVINLIVSQVSLDVIVKLTAAKLTTNEPIATESAKISTSIINAQENSYSGALLGKAESKKYLNELQQALMSCEDAGSQFEAWRARTNL